TMDRATDDCRTVKNNSLYQMHVRCRKNKFASRQRKVRREKKLCASVFLTRPRRVLVWSLAGGKIPRDGGFFAAPCGELSPRSARASDTRVIRRCREGGLPASFVFRGLLGFPRASLLPLLARDGSQAALEAVLREAAKQGTLVEINAQPSRLDLDSWCVAAG